MRALSYGGAVRRLIATPLFACSIGVLVLNDHVLKAAWPGLVTGKLSDVAGVVMVAIVLAAVLRRPAAAFSLTVVGFVVLKSVPAAPEWAAPLFGGVTRTDPTDLVALVALVPLWMWVHRPDRPGAAADTWALPIRIALVGAAVFATSATSCGSEGITRVAEIDGMFVAADNRWSRLLERRWQRVERWRRRRPRRRVRSGRRLAAGRLRRRSLLRDHHRSGWRARGRDVSRSARRSGRAAARRPDGRSSRSHPTATAAR